MSRKHFLEIMAIGWMLLITFGGCAQHQNQELAGSEKYAAQQGEGKYLKEISKLEETARSATDTSERMQAHLELAHLYTSYNNHQRNYNKALQHLEIYASLQPDFSNEKNLRNWLSALKEMDGQSQKINQLNQKLDQSQLEISKLKKTTKKLKGNHAKIKKANIKLTESNETLAKTIEMLKNIDRNIEEKRKNYTSH
jgi:hypothetical protein